MSDDYCMNDNSITAELRLRRIVNSTLTANQSLHFRLPLTTAGVTTRIEALLGSIYSYASDVNCRPSSTSYVWTSLITYYDDTFLQPSPFVTVGRYGIRSDPRSLYITIQGIDEVNNFMMNTTIGDTTIQSMGL